MSTAAPMIKSSYYTQAATRLAGMIGTIKALLIVLTVLGTLLLVGAAADADSSPLVITALMSGALSVLTTYVVFGWFEQTLRMLIHIAENTAVVNGEGSNFAHHP